MPNSNVHKLRRASDKPAIEKAKKAELVQKVKALKLLEGAEAIDKAIQSLKVRGGKLQTDMHIAALSCLMHADKHGDVTLAGKLIEALPSVTRKNALRRWFEAFGKFIWNADDKRLAFNKKADTKLDAATAKPFWEYTPEPEYRPMDLRASINRLIAQAEARLAQKNKADKIDPEMVEMLKTLAKVGLNAEPADAPKEEQKKTA